MNRGVPIVLLIEHEPIQSVTLARGLKEGGYSVIPVSRASDALEIFVTHHVDIALVVADTQTATSAGPPLLGALHDIDPQVRVVAMTPAAAARAAGAGAGTAMKPIAAIDPRAVDRYPNVVATLTKPVAPAELLAHVQRALETPLPEERHLSTLAVGAVGFSPAAGAGFSWPPSEAELDDIQVVDTQADPTAIATVVTDWRRPKPDRHLSLASSTPPPQPEPSAQHEPRAEPAPPIRLVARGRESSRRVPRFVRMDRWVAVAATALGGLTLTTLLEVRGVPVKRAIIGEPAPTTAVAPALWARDYRVGTMTLVPARRVRSQIVAARIDGATGASTRLASALQPEHRSTSRTAARRDTTLSARTLAARTTPRPPQTPAAPTRARQTRTADAVSATALPVATRTTAAPPATPATASIHQVDAPYPSDARDATATTAAPVDATPAGRPQEDERGIYQVLQRYERAYERLDVDAARAVWPSLNTRALARAFDGLKEQALEFSRCRVAMAPREATAICDGRASYVPRVGHQTKRSEPREWTFRLRKVDQDWLISKAEVR